MFGITHRTDMPRIEIHWFKSTKRCRFRLLDQVFEDAEVFSGGNFDSKHLDLANS